MTPTVVELVEKLRAAGVQPSAQRLAIAEHVLRTDRHPSADDVLAAVRKRMPTLSRATVYNTLNLFVKQGLLRELVLAEGRVVFDPKTDRHHHFVDESTGRIHDVPWEALRVAHVARLDGFEVREYQVVMRGRRRAR